MRPPRLDAGLDGRAGVVDVRMDVPLAVPADHEHGVTELHEAAAQDVHRRVVGVGEEVHHLVLGHALLVGTLARVDVVGSTRQVGTTPEATVRVVGPRARTLSGTDALETLEQHDESRAAGVDDAGAREHRELLRGACERLP